MRGVALLSAALLVGCARAAPVPGSAGDATDGPGASSAGRPAPAAAGSAGPGAPGAGAAPLVVEADPNGLRDMAPPANLPPVPPPEITDVDLPGLRAELARFEARRRPVLVNYWATWCRPCVTELPALGDMARTWGESGPAILGVCLDRLTAADDSRLREQVTDMLQRARVSYPNRIISGHQPDVLDTLDVGDGIPVTILYDAAGREAGRWTGGIDPGVVAGAVRGLQKRLAPGQARGTAGDPGS